MAYTHTAQRTTASFSFRSYSLRVALRINMVLIALSVVALVLYVFFIAQAVFHATMRMDAARATHVLESEVAILEQTYLRETQALSLDRAESLNLVLVSEKQFVEKSAVSVATRGAGI